MHFSSLTEREVEHEDSRVLSLAERRLVNFGNLFISGHYSFLFTCVSDCSLNGFHSAFRWSLNWKINNFNLVITSERRTGNCPLSNFCGFEI